MIFQKYIKAISPTQKINNIEFIHYAFIFDENYTKCEVNFQIIKDCCRKHIEMLNLDETGEYSNNQVCIYQPGKASQKSQLDFFKFLSVCFTYFTVCC